MRKLVLLLSALIVSMIFSGCGGGVSSNNAAYAPLESPGIYKNLVMAPNGEFFVAEKVADGKVGDRDRVYKVEFNENNKLEKITSMIGDHIVVDTWIDTLGHPYQFSTLTVEYQDDFVKYNFKDVHMRAQSGYYDAYTILYKIVDGKAKIAYLYDSEGAQRSNSDGYAQMLFDYNDKGQLAKIGFAGPDGNRVMTQAQFYELRLKYADSKNPMPIEIANYGKDGNLMNDAIGIAKTVYKLDDQDRRIEARHFGSDDALKIKNSRLLGVFSGMGAQTFFSAGAITKYHYEGDERRPAEIAFFDKDERPIGLKELGNVASYKYTYTDGFVSSIRAFSTDGTPVTLDKDSFGNDVVEVLFERNELGAVSKVSFRGKDGNPVISSVLSCASLHYKSDENRRMTELSFFGTADEPINIADGRHRIVKEYNDAGELGLEIFYDKDGREIGRQKYNTVHGFSSANASPEEAAQNELAGFGISAHVSLTTYGHSSDGFLAVDTSKGRRILIVDRKNNRVADISSRKSFAEFGAQRNASYQSPWIVNFTVMNDTRDADADFGVWQGQNHMIPIYMLYSFNADGTVEPGMLTSGAGASPSHYQGYLKEQKNVDLANLLLTEALTLLEKANAAGMSI